MYLEHFHLTHPPFVEEPDSEIFFPGAKREEICQSMILDILAGKQLIKLIGPEGSGKTLICRLIAERLSSGYQVVVLDNPIGSFDELLRLVCLDLGMDPRGAHEQTHFFEALQQLLAERRASGMKTVLVIDEAEKLFLAALERLIRHVGDGPDGLDLVLVLAGRPGLDANLNQLAVFHAKVDVHAGYFLDNLTESETRQYLRYRVNAAGMRREQFAEVFTEGAVTKIFSAAKGNLRITNILADETLQASCAEKSFMVLLDHVEPEEEEPFKPDNKVIEIYELLSSNRLVIGALAGVAAMMLVIGVLLSGTGQEESAGGEPVVKTAATARPASAPGVREGGGTEQAVEDVLQPPPAPQEIRDGDKLYRERLGASASWLAGIYKGGFTIQLMMLVSDQAQSSIATTLTEDDYYQVREQLYVLRKKTSPPTIFVFYGMYDSLEAAREARNSMPVFLRKHHPYPLSISEAVKKIEN